MPPDALKVAMVVPVGRGGFLTYSAGLCHAIATAGADVTLITSAQSETVNHMDGFRVVRLLGGMDRCRPRALRVAGYGLSLLRLRHLLRRGRFDIAHFQDSLVPYLDAPFLASLVGNGLKTAYTAHDPDQDAIVRARRGVLDLRRRALSRIYKAVDAVFVLSGEARKDVIDRFRVPALKVVQVALGGYETPSAPSRAVARRALSIPADRSVVLFFGSLKPSKGLRHLIRAFPRLRSIEPYSLLLIAGEPPLGTNPGDYERLIRSTGMSDSIMFRPGYVPPEQVPNYFAAADIVALPYVRVYQSGVLHLSYGFGKPVVASSVGGLAEDVVDGKSGLLVPPGDEEALAAALAEAFRDQGQLTRMGEYARRLSGTRFSGEAVGRQTLDAYRALLQKAA